MKSKRSVKQGAAGVLFSTRRKSLANLAVALIIASIVGLSLFYASETGITISNVQSYPALHGNWTVMFNTTGTANLTISTAGETTWGDANEDYQLEFLEVRCGEQALDYTWIDDGYGISSVFIENYSCNKTGYEISKVNRGGAHKLRFQFGTLEAYAKNFASVSVSGSTIIDTNRTQYWNSGDFNNTNTTANNETLILANASGTAYYSLGNFTSAVFDPGTVSTWNNISWISNAIGELPSNQQVETRFANGNANMSGNVLLMHFNNDSAYGENNTFFYDFSGTGDNGTCSGTSCPVYNFTDKKLGTASMNFDGSNDIIDANGYQTSIFTVSLWIKTASSDAYDGLAEFTDSSGNRRGIGLASGSPLITYGALKFREASASSINNNNWHHVVATYDGTTPLTYVDGNSVSLGGELSAGVGTASDLIIGDFTVAGYKIAGHIDEVAIWNRTLSAAEILDIYKRGALRLNLTARSCDDAACSGESFTDIVNDTSPQSLSVSNNRYFQYRAGFETDNVTYTPELYNVTIRYNNSAAPAFTNQAQNTSTPAVGAAVLLSANWTDDTDLDKAILETNETGAFLNKTGVYGSPYDINLTAGQTWSNFTWQNASATAGTIVSWRVYANDTAGNMNRTGLFNFTVVNTLSFVSPTDNNGSTVYRDWTYINVSVTNTTSIDTFDIEWNGVNVTTYGRSLLMNCHFGDSYTCEEGEAGTSSGTSFTGGKFGQGLSINGSDTLSYSTTGNINKNQGTIQFWIKPTWAGNDGVEHVWFELGNEWWNRMRIGKDGGNYRVFMIWNDTDEDVCNYDISAWAANTWYHAAVTWVEGEFKVYENGVLKETCTSDNSVMSTLKPTMYIGSTLDGISQANATIDEFRIHDKVLSTSEIAAAYNAEYGRYFMNQTDLSDGTYTYYSWANDTSGTSNKTETRTITIAANCLSVSSDTTLTGNQSCIVISSNAMTLDCNGYSIVNNVSASYGIEALSRNNVTVRNCNVKNFTYGVYSTSSSNITIRNNTIYNNTWGVYFSSSNTISIDNNTIWKNYNDTNGDWLFEFSGDEPGGGIYLKYTDNSTVSNNTLTNQMTGLNLRHSRNITALGNNASRNTAWGFHLFNSSSNNITNNIADYNNRYASSCTAGGCDSAGILLEDFSHNNSIKNNSLKYSGDGFFIEANDYQCSNNNTVVDNDGSYSPNNAFEIDFCYNNTFRGNNATNSKYGFWVGHGHSTNITNNTISYNTYGIALKRADNNYIINNTIFGNSKYQILFDSENDNAGNSNDNTTLNTLGYNNITCPQFGTNLAKGKFLNATLSNGTGQYATDGMLANQSWFPGTVSPGAYYQVDLGSSQTFNATVIWPHIWNAIDWMRKFHINVSTTGQFAGEDTRVVSETDFPNTTFKTYTFAPVTARYVRIVSDVSQDWIELQEFEVYNGPGNLTGYFGCILDFYSTNSTNNTIENSTIGTSRGNVSYVKTSSTLTFVNTTFNKTRVSFEDTSNITLKWYLRSNVTDTAGNPLNEANVTIKDNFTTQVFNGNTTSDGLMPYIKVTEYIQNSSKTVNYTSHNISATKTGYTSNSTIRYVDESMTVNLILGGQTYPRNVTVAFALSPNTGKTGGFVRTLTIPTSLTGVIARLQSSIRLFTNAFSLTDAINAFRTLPKMVTQPLDITDNMQTILTRLRLLTNAMDLSEVASRIFSPVREVVQAMDLSETFGRVASFTRSLTDAMDLTETFNRVASFTRSLTDAMDLTESATRAQTLLRTVTGSLNISNTMSRIVSFLRSVTGSFALIEKTENKVSSRARLFLNGTEGDTTYTQGEIANLTASSMPVALNTTIYANYTGSLQNVTPTSLSPVTNMTDTGNLAVGNYIILANITGNASYAGNATGVNYTMTIKSFLEIHREQPNATGSGKNATIRLTVRNKANDINATNVNLTDYNATNWEIQSGTCSPSCTAYRNYVEWNLGNISTNNYTQVFFTVKAPGPNGLGTFKANATYGFEGRTDAVQGNEFTAQTQTGRAYFDFELDLNSSSPEVDRTINNGTNYTARLNVTNIGDAVPSDPVTIELKINYTSFNVSCSSCVEFTNDGSYWFLRWNETSWAVGETKTYLFYLNSSVLGYYNISSNSTYDPPPLEDTLSQMQIFVKSFSEPTLHSFDVSVKTKSPVKSSILTSLFVLSPVKVSLVGIILGLGMVGYFVKMLGHNRRKLKLNEIKQLIERIRK